MIFRWIRHLTMVVVCITASACAQSTHQTGRDGTNIVIPPEMMAQVDSSVSFAEFQASPHSYAGRTLMFGGVALNARRVKDRTEIELLQLPVKPDMTPSDRRTDSKGRFIAVHSGEFLDPATIEPGAALTIIGEAKGAISKPIDDSEYVYPVLDIKYVVNWSELEAQEGDRVYDRAAYLGSGFGPYGPYGRSGPLPYSYTSPFWGALGGFPYAYGPNYPFYPYSFVPAPPPPARKDQ
jgi:outer membrane lipoprotein